MKTNRTVRIMLFLLLVLVLLVACAKQPEIEMTETEIMPEATVDEIKETNVETLVTIKTTYVNFVIPEEYSELVQHMEAIEDDIAMEVFYLKHGDTEKELFRICFGKAAIGEQIGVLGDMPVMVSVCTYEDEDFTDEQEKTAYYSAMEQMNSILNQVREDSRFSEMENNTESNPAVIGANEHALRYWSVVLPENMSVEEFESDTSYTAEFYGIINDNQVKLYAICIGNGDVDSVIGTFSADGQLRNVGVKTYDPEAQEELLEEDRNVAYGMMETLNDVIQSIMACEDFSEELPE